jgi:hypothetical protein
VKIIIGILREIPFDSRIPVLVSLSFRDKGRTKEILNGGRKQPKKSLGQNPYMLSNDNDVTGNQRLTRIDYSCQMERSNLQICHWEFSCFYADQSQGSIWSGKKGMLVCIAIPVLPVSVLAVNLPHHVVYMCFGIDLYGGQYSDSEWAKVGPSDFRGSRSAVPSVWHESYFLYR